MLSFFLPYKKNATHTGQRLSYIQSRNEVLKISNSDCVAMSGLACLSDSFAQRIRALVTIEIQLAGTELVFQLNAVTRTALRFNSQ